jgi:SNF2 family DNA or RNA helicase
VEFLVKPWAHQLDAIKRAEDLTHFGFLFEPGTGKTLTAINSLRVKFLQNKRLLRTIVFCPQIVIENWKKEFAMHSKVVDRVIPVYGPGSKRVKLVEKFVKEDKPAIFVTNYESLLMAPLFNLFVKWQPEALVYDESHKLKNLKSKRTKAAVQLSEVAQYRFILTGTPILNSPMDLFSQFLVMDKGETFGRNFYAFRATYFYDVNAAMPKDRYFPNWKIRKGALEELNAKIKTKVSIVKKADCLDLPPLVRQAISVDLSPEQKRMYDGLKQELIAFLNDKACVAPLAITKALRLQQIVSGYICLQDVETGNEKTVHRFKENPRAEALKELLADITEAGHKVIVWAVFRENYEAIRRVCDTLKLSYVEVHGDIPDKKKFEAVDSFSNDPSVKVFIGHPGSGGIGINLVSASYSIFYSRSFSLENDLQAEARNYRGGSERHEKITRIDLVAPGTIDEAILARLSDKMEIGEAVLRDMIKEM